VVENATECESIKRRATCRQHSLQAADPGE
jgi:hypothetical protein